MNLLGGIPLGRWFGVRVVLSWLFLIYAAFQIMHSKEPAADGLQMALLFSIVLLHEFGHALSCKAVGGRAEHIVLWPLGGLAFVDPPPKAWAHLVTTVCGPLVNVVLIPISCLWAFAVLTHVPGEPPMDYIWRLLDPQTPFESPVHFYLRFLAGMSIVINSFLLVLNLLPVFPLDGGRILQEILWMIIGYPRSLLVSGMIGTVGGAAFVVLGLGLWTLEIPVPILGINYPLGVKDQPNTLLICIGIFAAMQSFQVYQRATQLQDWQKR